MPNYQSLFGYLLYNNLKRFGKCCTNIKTFFHFFQA
nr:MAG TPA: hypothetical protein [Caudoviricetes sp.]